MKKLIIVSSLLVGSISMAAEKIDWKVCDKDLKEFCTTIKEDHERHECLEEAPKGKVSKACLEFNSKLEGKFEDKHKYGEKHSH